MNIEEQKLPIDFITKYNNERFNSRTYKGFLEPDTASTLTDALHPIVSVINNNDATQRELIEHQRYENYLDDGGREPPDTYTLDSENARPSVENMLRPTYMERYRTNIYQRWIEERELWRGFTPDLNFDDLVSLWHSYRPQPHNTDTFSSSSSSGDTSSFEADTADINLTMSMTPPRSPELPQPTTTTHRNLTHSL
jgi:hypothetical protein